MTWSIFILIVLILNLVYVPLQYSFNLSPQLFTTIMMDNMPNYAFILEIILNFNTG